MLSIHFIKLRPLIKIKGHIEVAAKPIYFTKVILLYHLFEAWRTY